MVWLIALVLLLFYLLGLFVFHAPPTIHLLPVLIVSVLIVDYIVARRFSRK